MNNYRKSLFCFVIAAAHLNLLSSCAPIAAMSSTVTVGRSAAEERRIGEIIDDTVINNKIRAKFAKEDFKGIFAKVSASSIEGRVLLTGTVDTMDHSARASELVWQISGVKEVMNEIEVDEISLSTKTKDTWIATRVRSKLLFNKEIKSVNYSVEVNNGIVFLTGIAQTQEELDLAEDIASRVGGVTKVISYVVLKDDQTRNAKP